MRRLWVGAALLPILSGCSTIYDLNGRTPLEGRAPHVYGGTRTIFADGGFAQDFLRNGGNIASDLPPEIGGIIALPVLADFFATLVCDTLLLPATIPHELSNPSHPAPRRTFKARSPGANSHP